MRVSGNTLAATLALATMLGTTALVPAFAADSKNPKFSEDTYKYLELFGDVFERVRKDYVEEVSDQDLLENAINGMLTGLDPHSGYMPAKSFQDMQEQTKGEFGGLGIEVVMENGVVKVVSPIDDTPAARAGVQPGDYIIAIDGKAALGLTLNEAVEKMRGPVNSNITVTIRRQGRDPFDIKLTRAIVKIQSVVARAEGEVGYIRISSFNEQTQAGLEASVKKLRGQLGDKLKGYVVDLRNNPGGLLDQAVSVSDSFLDRGEIVSTRSRRSEETQRFNAKAGDLADGKPLVVLINDGSASASEIVAGALQDHGRAILLGTKSFGKGSVQTIVPLSRGESAMRLTTARYYTPSGRSIQSTGIVPDIEVQQARVERVNTPSFLRRSEADLPGALKNEPNKGQSAPAKPAPDAKDPDAKDPDAKAPGPTSSVAPPAGKPGAPAAGAAPGTANGAAADGKSPQPAAETEDYQLSRALDLLRGIALYQRAASTHSAVR